MAQLLHVEIHISKFNDLCLLGSGGRGHFGFDRSSEAAFRYFEDPGRRVAVFGPL